MDLAYHHQEIHVVMMYTPPTNESYVKLLTGNIMVAEIA